MADTIRGNFPDEECSDCGKKGCVVKHWGPLVPPGEVAFLCVTCLHLRSESSKKKEEPKPLGCNLKSKKIGMGPYDLPEGMHQFRLPWRKGKIRRY